MDIFDDLAAEEDRLFAIVESLDDARLSAPSAAPGWTVADVLVHLAQGEEAVIAAAAGRGHGYRAPSEHTFQSRRAELAAPNSRIKTYARMTLDEAMDDLVRNDRIAPADVLARWQQARLAALAALRAADPQRPLEWVDTPLKPATLATTRLAEHWAHGLDITGPLGIPFADTARLRHVAWLAHRTLPYAFALAGLAAPDVRCELTAPDGSAVWRYGPPDAPSAIVGSAGAFCRVAARRLAPEDSGLRAEGPHAADALRLIRTYAA
jgi:uncharacterized protein (TIGR03084 family)